MMKFFYFRYTELNYFKLNFEGNIVAHWSVTDSLVYAIYDIHIGNIARNYWHHLSIADYALSLDLIILSINSDGKYWSLIR